MRTRGRPPYPDILTPRQWEVLALLREGLSNEEIARRLGISLDGVKFHVSEILGKLGVSNRNEAARWQREERVAPSASHRTNRGRTRLRRGRPLGAQQVAPGAGTLRCTARRRYSARRRHAALVA
jgi:DNA-binding CsgD family transcriptional regulator